MANLERFLILMDSSLFESFVLFQSQYIFVHDALLHYIESDFKIAIPIEDLKGHLHNLRRNLPNPSTGKTKLEVEFEVIFFLDSARSSKRMYHAMLTTFLFEGNFKG